jgi:glucosyl-3-phosphoglycerate phosphatase
MTGRLVLIRHGESAWNARGVLQGQADPPLSDLGRRQALARAPWAGTLAPASVETSDLARARDTATLLGWPDARPDARWREVDIGAWTGRTASEVRAAEGDGAFHAWRHGDHVPEGGESYDQLGDRVERPARELLATGGTHVVICHGGPIRMVCARLLGLDVRRLGGLGNLSATMLEGADGEVRLVGYNLLGEGAEEL